MARSLVHAAVPSSSVIVTVGMTLTNMGWAMNLGCPSSASDRHPLTATMAAPGDPSIKHKKSAKLAYSPLVKVWKARRRSGVMLVDLAAIPLWVVCSGTARRPRSGLPASSVRRRARPPPGLADDVGGNPSVERCGPLSIGVHSTGTIGLTTIHGVYPTVPWYQFRGQNEGSGVTKALRTISRQNNDTKWPQLGNSYHLGMSVQSPN